MQVLVWYNIHWRPSPSCAAVVRMRTYLPTCIMWLWSGYSCGAQASSRKRLVWGWDYIGSDRKQLASLIPETSHHGTLERQQRRCCIGRGWTANDRAVSRLHHDDQHVSRDGVPGRSLRLLLRWLPGRHPDAALHRLFELAQLLVATWGHGESAGTFNCSVKVWFWESLCCVWCRDQGI